jgi:pantothenate kinase
MVRCDNMGHIYDMSIYLEEDRQIITQAVMPRHVIMKTHHEERRKGIGHKL